MPSALRVHGGLLPDDPTVDRGHKRWSRRLKALNYVKTEGLRFGAEFRFAAALETGQGL